jgi:hypothetical protein
LFTCQQKFSKNFLNVGKSLAIVTVQSSAGDSIGDFAAAIGGMKGFLAPK